jgi:uncharacterized delta-60 repeat protein
LLEPLEGRRLMSAGDLDASFGGGDGRVTTGFANNSVDFASDVVVQPDGKTVVVGKVGNNGAIVRYNVDGSLDTTFGPDGSGMVFRYVEGKAVALQPDGKIVVLGSGYDNPTVARYLPNGTFDTTFSGDGWEAVDFNPSANFGEDVAVQKDGKILVLASAYTGTLDADYDFAVARLLPDGSLDRTFGSVVQNYPELRSGTKYIGFGKHEFARALAVDYNGSPQTNPHYGKIVIAGETQNHLYVDSSTRFAVARLTPNGSVDSGFGGNGRVDTRFPGYTYGSARGVVALPGGKVAAVGAVSANGPASGRASAMVRYRSDGSPDPLFGLTGDGQAVHDLPGEDWSRDVVVGHDGKLLLAGTADGDLSVIRYKSDGILDTSFSGDGLVTADFGAREGASALALAPDGRFVVVGSSRTEFTTLETTQTDFVIARYIDASPTVSVFAVDSTARENANDPATFIVARDQYLPFATRVYVTAGGTAASFTSSKSLADYTGISKEPGTGRWYVDIPAGQNFVMVTIRPVIDGYPEETETAVFTISPGIGRPYDVSPFNSSVSILIEDGPPLTTV